MSEIYYAKSPGEDGEQITNRAHLAAVAALARRFGAQVGMEEEAELDGKLHDFGKYGASFQNVLRGTESGIDHAVGGAGFLFLHGKNRSRAYRRVAEVIAAHHSALRAYDALRPELEEVCRGRGRGICASGRRAALVGPEAYLRAQEAFRADFPDFRFPKLKKYPDESETGQMLRTRMLFSCLVDADYTVSAGGEAEERTLAPEPLPLLKALYRYMETLRAASRSDPGLNALRDRVFRQCGEAGEQAPGVFTLTAPTGVGKTLSLLHFALRHCAAHGKRRIILVLPFLTLTEQSEREYARLIPDILSDHSQSRLSEEARELAARWDAPFLITTSVRFFEGLFASRPKDCRKLHNIAQSVVIFDEAQSLPSELAAAAMRSLDLLCRDYGCTAVLSTATQPEFAALPDLDGWSPREILPDGAALYAALRRTRLRWQLDTLRPLDDIAAEMAELESVCVIVNLRRHARSLFEGLRARCGEDTVFFLTTDLCPKHRSAVIDTVRDRLRRGLPCRVVATQCIEAGVDLDFSALFRALAPLEAIIQAAGRCNRNGAQREGVVTVFLPEDSGTLYPGDAYQRGAEIVKVMWAAGGVDIHDPAVIADYYRLLFQGAGACEKLRDAIRAMDYAGAEESFRLIRRQGVQVIVPFDRALYDRVCAQARREGLTAALIREAAPVTVSTYREDLVRACCEQVSWRRRGPDGAESDYYILPAGREDRYRPDTGLRLEPPGGQDEPLLF